MTLATALYPSKTTRPLRQAQKPEITFQTWLEQHGHSPATISSYLADLRVFERWLRAYWKDDAYSTARLTGYDLRTWREHTLHEEQRSPATWNRRKASMALYCNYLREVGAISHDPMRELKPAAEVQRPPRWLTAQELARLMRGMELAESRANTEARKAMARRDVAMIGLMLLAGLREAEVVNLRFDDVRLTERQGEVKILGKGEKTRSVPVCNELRHWLNAYLESPLAPLQKGGLGGFIFPMTTRQVQKRVAEMGRECKIDELTPHRFRHVSVKRMVIANVPLETIRVLHGHSRIEITMRYAAAGWEDMQEAVERGSMASLPKGR